MLGDTKNLSDYVVLEKQTTIWRDLGELIHKTHSQSWDSIWEKGVVTSQKQNTASVV